MQDRQPRRIVIEQRERTANRPARQQVAGLVFLKGARAAADQLAGGGLAQSQLLADRRMPSGSINPSLRALSRFSIRSETFISSPV